MPHKKKSFIKNSSARFMLIHGNSQAVNADGEVLQNVLVPVSKNYKPGSSLLMSNIASVCDAEPIESSEDDMEPDLNKMMEEFNLESEDYKVEYLRSKRRQRTFAQITEKPEVSSMEENLFEDCSDDENYSDVSGQFSDASSCSDSKYDLPSDCPENWKIFEARFDKVLEGYGKDQIGPLEDEEICGYLSHDSERAKDIIATIPIATIRLPHKKDRIPRGQKEIVLEDLDEELKGKVLNYSEYSGDEEIVEIVTEEPLEFDCESILSTHSNIYNHPAVIKEENVKKIKIPNNPLKKRLTKSQLKTLNSESEDDESDDDVSIDTTTSINVRQKGESPEERRQRKNLFKEAKRESRIFKKENKLAFKREKKIQEAQHLNSQCTSGIKLL